ncbi:MAG: Rpn family recombination-promoting nuclease/putative transposase, partial [Spirochaetaceae bacterium]|nr:Rpn family recombination-promoting nuclease/putative transposase [Spirochaetaceae bacterium]
MGRKILVRTKPPYPFLPITLGECILDVRALTNKREKINIEVQLKNLHNMSKRSLFYWSREYLQKMAEGDDYRILPNVITINIVNFDYIPLEAFHTSF